jgi:hypothetical protein
VYCSNCQMRGSADRNASIAIGHRLLVRYKKKEEKPQAPLATKTLPERPVKTGGVIRSQGARRARRPSIQRARHGKNNALGITQGVLSGMVDNASGIPTQLRLFNE